MGSRLPGTVRVIAASAAPVSIALGGNSVPVESTVPNVIELPSGEREGVFVIEWSRLTARQQENVLDILSSAYSKTTEHLRAEFDSGAALCIPARDCLFDALTAEHAAEIRRRIPELWVPKHGPVDHVQEAFLVAREVVCSFLGHVWWERNVWEELDRQSKRVAYLHFAMETDLERFKSVDRLIDIGDSLFLLQSATGFIERIAQLRALVPEKRGQEIEPIAIELQIAKILVRSGHDLTFVKPQGQKGKDYDFRVQMDSGPAVCVEAEVKMEATPVRVSSLRHTLDEARRQMPHDEPGVIVVWVAEPWVEDATFRDGVESTLERFFQRTGRISGVVLVWERWGRTSNGLWARAQFYRPFTNQRARCPIALERLFLPPATPGETPRLRLSFGAFG